MRSVRRVLSAALVLPLAGCVFAVGSDDDEIEGLRDRVREMERRVDRLERPWQGWGQPVPMFQVEGQGRGTFQVVPAPPAPKPPEKEPGKEPPR